jgi:tRNA(fMet)-specific endonuclease VapC
VIHFDTAFLIDLEREWAREKPSAAFEFLEGLDDSEIVAVSVFGVAELRLGAELSRNPIKKHREIDELLEGWVVVSPGDSFASRFAREAAALRRSGDAVAMMDLMIGVAALLDDAPVVTRNVKDFSRIPGLRVLSY